MFRFIDLFAGIGGFHLALNSYGAECVFASEWDKKCREIYYLNHGILPAGDITQIAEEYIPSHDILCAGFPCQAFSISGKQLGFEDTRGTLFFDVARIAKYHQPKVLILENVKNLINHDNGNSLKVILSTLDDIGYNVFYKLLNSSYFGVPQKRERVYFVAFRKDLSIKTFEFPKPEYNPTKLIDICLPDIETEEYIFHRDDIKLKDNINLTSDYPQKPVRIGEINKGSQGERIYHQNGHSITLSANGGGGGAKTGIYQINNKIRKLAPRECARLMGFPDSFIISNTKNVAWKQFGNSVVIPVVKDIFKEILQVL
jgi:DNA (cytosine-5)-methyltransferase 1